MGGASWAEAAEFVGVVISVLWVALAVAVCVFALAPLWIASRAISQRLERRYLPVLARWSRRRAGVAGDAGPWVCAACRSVNPPTVVACYSCGGPRPVDAPELQEAATNPDVFHRPPRLNEFDPSRYRGPGVAQPASSGAPAPSPPSPAPAPSPEPLPPSGEAP